MKDLITLFLMTEKGYRVLEVIASSSPGSIESVVSSRDPNVTRDYYDEIESLCNANGIQFLDRHKLKTVNSRFAIAVSWRWLIDASSTTLVVFHDSLLPKYRGFAPLVSALINGEQRIGVTALFANEDYDRGDIIMQSGNDVSYPITVQSAIELLAKNYRELAIEITGRIAENKPLVGKKQDESEVSYSLWRDENDYFIDWSQDAEEIRRFIDAVGYPYKGSLTWVEGKRARILKAEVCDDVHIENRTPGKVLFMSENKPVVVCGKGLLKISHIIDDHTRKSLLPFSKFRLRFK